MQEIWKSIEGLDLYEVSNLGRVRGGRFNRTMKGYISGVLLIRKKKSEGSTVKSLANEFDITPMTIRDIIGRRSWKHV